MGSSGRASRKTAKPTATPARKTAAPARKNTKSAAAPARKTASGTTKSTAAPARKATSGTTKATSRATSPARRTTPPRITDLAAELGYSASTISRALNGDPIVGPELTARIRAHAAKRGYVANRLAQSLTGAGRRFVGFLVPDVENRPYSIAASAVANSLAAAQHQLIVAISGDDPKLEQEALRSLVGAQVAAVIVAPTARMTKESKQLLATCPAVQFNRTLRLGTASVLCHDRTGLAAATRHLLTLGHRDIAYLGTSTRLSNGRDRLRGVTDTLGTELPAARQRLLPPTEDDGYAGTRELLESRTPPTALVVGSSSLSIGAARAVHELGVSIPTELSLVVYGDPSWGELYEPRLTTVSVPYRAMGQQVADTVMAMLNGGQQASRPPRHRLAAELIVRESTAQPARRSDQRRKSTTCASRT
ncbi:MAG: LacI family DNA-binding transcriptional regulator [Streptosporangiales bacterium]|nr:LacI family DNA-binding transcriptional regulator [Streptosporangiales bacterium]